MTDTKLSRNKRNVISLRDKGMCRICGKRAQYSKWKHGYWHFYEVVYHNSDEYHLCFKIDHIVPLFQGGKADIDNLQLVCMKCNREKGSRERRNGMV